MSITRMFDNAWFIWPIPAENLATARVYVNRKPHGTRDRLQAVFKPLTARACSDGRRKASAQAGSVAAMPPSMPTLPRKRRRVAVRVMSAAAVAKPLSNRRGDDGETRAASLGRADVDAVPEQIGGVLDDKEPQAETVRPAVIGPAEDTQHRRQP